jgi:hypothetical protein
MTPPSPQALISLFARTSRLKTPMVPRSVATTRIYRGIVTHMRAEVRGRRAVPATTVPLQRMGVRSLEGGNRGPSGSKTYGFEEVRFHVLKLEIGGVDAVWRKGNYFLGRSDGQGKRELIMWAKKWNEILTGAGSDQRTHL